MPVRYGVVWACHRADTAPRGGHRRADNPAEGSARVPSHAAPACASNRGRVGSLRSPTGYGSLSFRVMLGRDVAIVDIAGRRAWSGAHQLNPNRPRYIGLRFLRRDNAASDAAMSFTSFKVTKP